ncbi:bacteriohopanetetrol glucosamine biosynthesis glycosyltransferase HpnI [Paraburkholderia flava]|uniref:bacteriohopanetetrol glucosamine biosynthesis glycosyltransferase HpnI n=1 Tax=Paraburkholderia flava TaxID=2547393 RepID=UPI00105B89E4|nr:bacteriohopanetetrol glucosamine biosynthesis glycosyltransferase HpnI [Paraburkholderia flava]
MTALHAWPLSQWLIACACGGAALYAIFAALAMPFFFRRERHGVPQRTHRLPAVTVFKPLCGDEPRLYDNLATFCEQTCDRFQLLFGVSAWDDAAIAIVQRLRAAYPHIDIELIVDARVYGSNLKVSNLINMSAYARHDLFVIADSDIAVRPDYLATVVAPLNDASVGVVTCLYEARGIGGFWPRVGALFINEWFVPSVRIAHAAGSRDFGFGATLALRRETLERIGGFAALRDCLADDYWLARHARELGLRTVLSPVVVATDVIEQSFTALWRRETRWLRTIRSVNRLGFACLPISFTSPWLPFAAWLASRASSSGHACFATTMTVCAVAGLVARVLLHARCTHTLRSFWRDLPLVPLRDGLFMLQWLGATVGTHVVWRGARVPVTASLTPPTPLDNRGIVDVMETSDGG